MAGRARLNHPPAPILLAVAYTLLLVAASAPGDEAPLAERQHGDCGLRLEAHPQWRSARVRVLFSGATRCTAGTDAVAMLLAEGLALADSRFDSLALGRLIDYEGLPGALRSLAAADPGWDASHGRPSAGEVNAHVAHLLERGAVFEALLPALAEHGYALLGLSVEKVLVDADGLPFDAQLWLRLGPL